MGRGAEGVRISAAGVCWEGREGMTERGVGGRVAN